MEDLFRFVALRPAQTADATLTVSLALDTPFQRTLAGIRNGTTTVRGADGNALPPAEAMAAEARKFQSGAEPYAGRFVSDPATLSLGTQYLKLRNDLLSAPAEINLAGLTAKVSETFTIKDADTSRFFAGDISRDQMARIYDSVIALFLAPAQFPSLLKPLTELAQAIGLVQRTGARDVRLTALAPIRAALSASLLLPPQIFPIDKNQIQPVGVADLLVVKQRLKQYELGDVSTIENVLRGETRRRTNKHTLTRDETLISEMEKTTETTKELTTAERFELKQESEDTLKEDLSVKAGVAISAKYGAVQIDAKTDVAYSTAKSESTKLAQTTARDVTQRAASKVTERVRRQLTTRVTETSEETDERALDNSKATDNVSGVYQFVNKVYEAQVFNYGKRLLFDIMVPEPAAFLLDAVADRETREAPVKPVDFNLGPHQIDWTDNDRDKGYGALAARYGAVLTGPPDAGAIAIQRSYSDRAENDEANNNLEAHENIEVPEGYLAVFCKVAASYNNKDQKDHSMGVIVGDQSFGWTKDDTRVQSGNLEKARTVAVAIHTANVRDYNVTVSLRCEPRGEIVEDWRLKTYDAIATAYREQVKSYEDKLAALSFQARGAAAIGNGNPDRNREVERNELKKSCIALLGKVDLLGFGAIDNKPSSPLFPRPAGIDKVREQGRIIRFFEQAFEWDQIAYVFYPYYWGRKETWYDKVLKDCDDPIFGQFLRAGEARVVVPVRSGFEADIRYFLLTGQLWGGADLPSLTDAAYLPITEEIKELSGAAGEEVPYGKAWDVKLPTNLIKLRPDGKLPKWLRISPDAWVWQSATKDDV